MVSENQPSQPVVIVYQPPIGMRRSWSMTAIWGRTQYFQIPDQNSTVSSGRFSLVRRQLSWEFNVGSLWLRGVPQVSFCNTVVMTECPDIPRIRCRRLQAVPKAPLSCVLSAFCAWYQWCTAPTEFQLICPVGSCILQPTCHTKNRCSVCCNRWPPARNLAQPNTLCLFETMFRFSLNLWYILFALLIENFFLRRKWRWNEKISVRNIKSNAVSAETTQEWMLPWKQKELEWMEYVVTEDHDTSRFTWSCKMARSAGVKTPSERERNWIDLLKSRYFWYRLCRDYNAARIAQFESVCFCRCEKYNRYDGSNTRRQRHTRVSNRAE